MCVCVSFYVCLFVCVCVCVFVAPRVNGCMCDPLREMLNNCCPHSKGHLPELDTHTDSLHLHIFNQLFMRGLMSEDCEMENNILTVTNRHSNRLAPLTIRYPATPRQTEIQRLKKTEEHSHTQTSTLYNTITKSPRNHENN